MSLAVADVPAQATRKSAKTNRKQEDARQRKKDTALSQGLRKKKIGAKYYKKDPWVNSRKKKNQRRNIRKDNRRAKVERSFAEYPIDEAAACASEPVAAAAPTTPLTGPTATALPAPTTPLRKALNITAGMESISLQDQADCGTPTEASEAGDAAKTPAPPKPLKPVQEDSEERAETLLASKAARGFTEDYTAAKKKDGASARGHTNVKNHKKMRRPARGSQKVLQKHAVSHKLGKRAMKNRRRAQRRAKTEMHLGLSLSYDAAPAAPASSAPRNKGKWVKVEPKQDKGDCASIEPPIEEVIPEGEGQPGKVPTNKPVESSNPFAPLKRRNRRPRWQKKRWRKKRTPAERKAEEEAKANAVAEPVQDQEAKEPEGKRRRYRQRKRRGPKKPAQPATEEATAPEQAQEPPAEEAPAPAPAADTASPPRRKRNRRWRKKKPAAAKAEAPAPKSDAPAAAAAPEPEQAKPKRKPRRRNRKPKKSAVEDAPKPAEGGDDKPDSSAKPKKARRKRYRNKGKRNQDKQQEKPQPAEEAPPTTEAAKPPQQSRRNRQRRNRRRRVWQAKREVECGRRIEGYVPGPSAVDL